MVNNPARPVGDRQELDARQHRCREAELRPPLGGKVPRSIDDAIVERWRHEPRGELAAQLFAMVQGSDDSRARHRFDEYLLAAAHALTDPIPMVLHCPSCGTQHIDEATPEWPNPPHRSHLCGADGCGTIWRPADVPTVGVRAVKTSSTCDNWPPTMQDEGDLPTTPLRGFASRDIKQGEAITAADIVVGPATVHVPLMHDAPEPGLLPACPKAPVGWRCTRGTGHDGPCAAVKVGEAPLDGC